MIQRGEQCFASDQQGRAAIIYPVGRITCVNVKTGWRLVF
jgi:hypothetical protein